MLANSYLIVSPAGPTDIGAAVITQRQTIPLVWAMAVSSEATTLTAEGSGYYFSTTVGDALAILDRGMAGWNYNTYLRDTLAPVGVFRAWLANYPSELQLYLNFSELIRKSPNIHDDIEALKTMGYRYREALKEIEDKNFTVFLHELRKLSYPFITIPITGNRKRDIEILRYEVRDTSSFEAEMALQMVGVDRDKSLLLKAVESIMLIKPGSELEKMAGESLELIPAHEDLTLYTHQFSEGLKLLSQELGCEIVNHTPNHTVLNAHGRKFMLVHIMPRDDEEVE